MKKTILMMLVAIVCSLSVSAQSAADKILGTYYAEQDGKASKIKIFKYQDGYRAQVYWVKETKNPDGSLKTDLKNPDKSLRNIPVDKIVIIDKIVYDNGVWKGGKVYDPTTGKRWKVEVKFKDAKTLQVRGSLFGIGKSVYWPKLS